MHDFSCCKILGAVNGADLHSNYDSILRTWHMDHPVSKEELLRNDLIYGFQNNRNPFVDNPDWVNLIDFTSVQG